MKIWRLIAHHEDGHAALSLMKKENKIAIGWTAIGSLDSLSPRGSSTITKTIKSAYPSLDNAHLGGPSLWSFYQEMAPGDLVIVNYGNVRRCVFEVIGDYFFSEDEGVLGYGHLRSACLTDIFAEELWSEVGRKFADNQSSRWTLALCSESSKEAIPIVYEEGARFSVTSSAIERSPEARAACLQEHGYSCAACCFNFGDVYGDLGKGYIHVHHREDLSLSQGIVNTDPRKDLIPLCPNCHAMVHKCRPAMTINELIKIINKHHKS
ncbi:MAG: HNH endonuclease [Pseudomonadota bacterium]